MLWVGRGRSMLLNEHRTEAASAKAEGLTQKQFNDRMNNPDKYQLEDPSSNRSHRFEKKP
ncbi:TPA: HNH/ENDO VII family nuclease [Stenotrophomonas maltophilia]|nr:HNH/ENDO VII family nuclease [Stenotrophomonas maltophilia]HDS1171431.1 HNH/ENDO VII family nuclease [Stenotrophomonas maltophilia]HDS1181814.1 HNH/ENDO VII family nuclease [Stenotrophomonas maltophilia]